MINFFWNLSRSLFFFSPLPSTLPHHHNHRRNPPPQLRLLQLNYLFSFPNHLHCPPYLGVELISGVDRSPPIEKNQNKPKNTELVLDKPKSRRSGKKSCIYVKKSNKKQRRVSGNERIQRRWWWLGERKQKKIKIAKEREQW